MSEDILDRIVASLTETKESKQQAIKLGQELENLLGNTYRSFMDKHEKIDGTSNSYMPETLLSGVGVFASKVAAIAIYAQLRRDDELEDLKEIDKSILAFSGQLEIQLRDRLRKFMKEDEE